MNIAIELDGVICTPIRNFVALDDVDNCEVYPEAQEAITNLKCLNHTIMIYSSRELSLGPSTELWLQRNKIPYDYLILGKPRYDIFIDRKNYKLIEWSKFFEDCKYRIHNS